MGVRARDKETHDKLGFGLGLGFTFQFVTIDITVWVGFASLHVVNKHTRRARAGQVLLVLHIGVGLRLVLAQG